MDDYENPRDRRRIKRTAAPLGQHLLTNPKYAAMLAEAAGIKRGTNVFEIGPGKGMLTSELLKRGATVLAVEKDPAMIEALEETHLSYIRRGQLVIRYGDARELTPDLMFPRGAYTIAANIPYYITGELLRTALTSRNQPRALAFLIQKEVAERIARSKKESLLSLSVKAYGEATYVTTVKRGNFAPPPKVDSAILSVTNISRKNFAHVDENEFFFLIKTAFGQKRKAFLGTLTRASKKGDLTSREFFVEVLPRAHAVLEKHFGTARAKKMRAEDVSLEQWLEMLDFRKR